jgi:FixJ family two-component response regulator
VSAEPMISIIDDDESLRTALVSLVRSLGYRACGFASAEAFLQSGLVRSVACIVADIQMPGMSGIDLKRHLETCGFQSPVIMITARTEPGLEDRALASGARYFLRKPFEANLLIDCLERILKSTS